MGLDMYLTKKTYVGANWEHRNVEGKIIITKSKDNEPIKINFKRVSYIEEGVGYWRKANQIHKWFVDNVQDGTDDCGTYSVSDEKLQELLSVCKKVKESVIMKDGAVTNGYIFEGGVKIPCVEEGKEIVNPQVAHNL